MLVLSRKKGERIVIGDIILEVLEVRSDKVRLGIVAPKGVPVHRAELAALACEPPQSLEQIMNELEEETLSEEEIIRVSSTVARLVIDRQ